MKKPESSPSEILESIARIIFGVAVAGGALLGVAVLLIRQPVIGITEYRESAPRSSPDALRRHVEFLTADARPRDASHAENLDLAAHYIECAFAGAGGRVSVQPFVAGRTTYRNVAALFGPADDTRPLLVVGAHYDAFSPGTSMPGADDNASGTAGLLELARLLGQSAPRNPVMLVAYANEEPPFFASERMGSAVHAGALRGGHRHVAGMICLEMIGYFAATQRYDSWVIDAIYPARGDFIAVCGGWDDRGLARSVKKAMRGAGGVPVLSVTAPREMLDASDQRNYWSHGWNAVMVTDTAYLRNPNYHAATDLASTLDYGRMARVVDGVFNAVTGP